MVREFDTRTPQMNLSENIIPVDIRVQRLPHELRELMTGVSSEAVLKRIIGTLNQLKQLTPDTENLPQLRYGLEIVTAIDEFFKIKMGELPNKSQRSQFRDKTERNLYADLQDRKQQVREQLRSVIASIEKNERAKRAQENDSVSSLGRLGRTIATGLTGMAAAEAAAALPLSNNSAIPQIVQNYEAQPAQQGLKGAIDSYIDTVMPMYGALSSLDHRPPADPDSFGSDSVDVNYFPQPALPLKDGNNGTRVKYMSPEKSPVSANEPPIDLNNVTVNDADRLTGLAWLGDTDPKSDNTGNFAVSPENRLQIIRGGDGKWTLSWPRTKSTIAYPLKSGVLETVIRQYLSQNLDEFNQEEAQGFNCYLTLNFTDHKDTFGNVLDHVVTVGHFVAQMETTPSGVQQIGTLVKYVSVSAEGERVELPLPTNQKEFTLNISSEDQAYFTSVGIPTEVGKTIDFSYITNSDGKSVVVGYNSINGAVFVDGPTTQDLRKQGVAGTPTPNDGKYVAVINVNEDVILKTNSNATEQSGNGTPITSLPENPGTVNVSIDTSKIPEASVKAIVDQAIQNGGISVNLVSYDRSSQYASYDQIPLSNGITAKYTYIVSYDNNKINITMAFDKNFSNDLDHVKKLTSIVVIAAAKQKIAGNLNTGDFSSGKLHRDFDNNYVNQVLEDNNIRTIEIVNLTSSSN